MAFSNTPLAPYLIIKNAAKAIKFYQKIFGFKEIFRLVDADGKIGHAELKRGKSKLMLADEYLDFQALSPETVGGTSVTIHLYVGDVDQVVAKAVAAKAIVLQPAKDQFFGDRSALIQDPFGHKWHLATRKEEISPEEMQNRWDVMVT